MFGSETTELCARKDGYSPDDNVLCNVEMIRIIYILGLSAIIWR